MSSPAEENQAEGRVNVGSEVAEAVAEPDTPEDESTTAVPTTASAEAATAACLCDKKVGAVEVTPTIDTGAAATPEAARTLATSAVDSAMRAAIFLDLKVIEGWMQDRGTVVWGVGGGKGEIEQREQRTQLYCPPAAFVVPS